MTAKPQLLCTAYSNGACVFQTRYPLSDAPTAEEVKEIKDRATHYLLDQMIIRPRIFASKVEFEIIDEADFKPARVNVSGFLTGGLLRIPVWPNAEPVTLPADEPAGGDLPPPF